MGNVLSDRVTKTHRLVASEQELRETISRELAAADLGEPVIMGGHFMLFEDDATGRLVPGVIEEQHDETMRRRVTGRVGIFPRYTWRLSLDLARPYVESGVGARLLLLINDWQYVPRTGRPASELRAEFFEGLTELPAAYRDDLAEAGLSADLVLPSRKHPLAFPETWLKYRFQKAADKFVKQGLLEKRFLGADEPAGPDQPGRDTEVAFLDADGNYRTLISCGVTGCAGEITEMIAEVHRAGHRTILIFAPGECLMPVRTGVEIALSLYGLRGMRVVIADPGGSGEMTEDEIYGNLVSVHTFRS
ncbi:LPD16 domain-containing protein [Nonomuraea sp. CA-218870]|uniref:LPD16 domain-containing protein n=1 Tax=Nonomuraea sp. CA-218870 TaxID=3239998 RepID=UPI003D93D428